VLQTNPTPDNALLGGYIINTIESDTSVTALGVTTCALCPALDALRSHEGWASSTPSGLRDLADQADSPLTESPILCRTVDRRSVF
jgi:hypothetical protein